MDGNPVVRVSGKIVGLREQQFMMSAIEDLILTGGPWDGEFRRKIASYLGVRSVSLCNSGSSANLLALSALTSHEIPEERRLMPGDVVVTTATAFPTTVAPILQLDLVPFYADIELGSYNINCEWLEAALPWKPKAIMIAHALGNPFNLDEVLKWCARNGIWLIEDNCDALGATWNGQKTGSFGVYSTLSFYPAHHITTGEGGAVASYNGRYAKILNSFRDWGRDCWCEPGRDNTCNKRFSQKHGDLPFGYDHKYTYSHLGYNMKMTEMQAACGAAQMDRIEAFVQKRRDNFSHLFSHMLDHGDIFLLPKWDTRARPSWFGFPITIRDKARFSRHQLVGFLESFGIATRPIFAGNIMRQPAFVNQERIGHADDMINADKVMRDSFWVGVWPGLDDWHIDYMADIFRRFRKEHT